VILSEVHKNLGKFDERKISFFVEKSEYATQTFQSIVLKSASICQVVKLSGSFGISIFANQFSSVSKSYS